MQNRGEIIYRRAELQMHAFHKCITPTRGFRVNPESTLVDGRPTSETTMKTCSRCHIEKPLSQFWYCKSQRRHIAVCDDCRRAHGRAYFRAHAVERRAATRAYRLRNLEKVRAASLAWQRNNPE